MATESSYAYLSKSELDQEPTDSLTPALDVDPILDYSVPNSADDLEDLRGGLYTVSVKKCSCNSVWCRTCYSRRGARLFAEKLDAMSWPRVRQVVLTVDPQKFPDARTAYEKIQKASGLSYFIKNLRRAGVVIINHQWVLEWHHGGFPHWHMFIETDKEGRAGKIGNKRLLECWPFGLVREIYIRNEDHWRKFTAYFAANGYFSSEKKQYQFKLPEWALDVPYRIRKTGGHQERRPVDSQLIEHIEDKQTDPQEHRTYREILTECGQSILIEITRPSRQSIFYYFTVPYQKIKELEEFKYSEGQGLVATFKRDQALIFLEWLKLNEI